jgi:hypothetical protein
VVRISGSGSGLDPYKNVTDPGYRFGIPFRMHPHGLVLGGLLEEKPNVCGFVELDTLALLFFRLVSS